MEFYIARYLLLAAMSCSWPISSHATDEQERKRDSYGPIDTLKTVKRIDDIQKEEKAVRRLLDQSENSLQLIPGTVKGLRFKTLSSQQAAWSSLRQARTRIDSYLRTARDNARINKANARMSQFANYMQSIYSFGAAARTAWDNLSADDKGSISTWSENTREGKAQSDSTRSRSPASAIDTSSGVIQSVNDLKQAIKWLKNHPPNFEAKPGLKLTEAEVKIQASLQFLTGISPTEADKFEARHKLDFENWLVDQTMPSINPKKLLPAGILEGIRLFLWSQPIGDSEPGGRVHRAQLLKQFEAVAAPHIRWRSGAAPDARDPVFPPILFAPDERLLLPCQTPCVRSARPKSD